MEEAFARIKGQMDELGLNLAVWDKHGQRVDDFELVSEFCRTVHGLDPHHCEVTHQLVQRILSENEPGKNCTDCCCCVIGVPLHQRRRLRGAVTVCYPPRELLKDQCLPQLAERLRLDQASLNESAERSCRHSSQKAHEIMRMLSWLLKTEHDLHIANDELATLSTNLAGTYEELSLLYRISGSMKVTQAPKDFLKNVCSDLCEVMSVESAAGVVYARATGEDDLVALSGSVDFNIDQVRLLAATQLAPLLAAGNRSTVVNKFTAAPQSGLADKIRNLVVAPLASDERIIGMLVGINKQDKSDLAVRSDFDSTDLKLINSIANQAAVFLENNRLYADLQELLLGMLHALTASIDAKDPYTRGHSERVAALSMILAQACGLPAPKVQRIYLSGLLHDIGKMGVPENVLCKTGRLTSEEYELVKHHPAIGANILQGIRQLDDILVGILTHHERLDGKGYPQGLSGKQVPLEGRIIGLADAFDAMTSQRTYRSAMELPAAIQEVRRCSNTQFDPILVEKLLVMDLAKVLKDLRKKPQNILEPGSLQEHVK